MFYIMYGQDSFSLQGELGKIKAELGDPAMLAINTTVLDGKQINLNQFQDVCNTMPFLHQLRLVIVEGLLGRFDSEKKTGKRTNKVQSKANDEMRDWRIVADYIEKMPATTVLIFIDGELDEKKNALLKHLSPIANIKRFPQLKGERINYWIKTRIAERGGKVSAKAIDLLGELAGNDLWHINSEIEKLIAFGHGRLITEDDVRQVTSYNSEANIFALVDAVLEGRRREAQQLLHRLFTEGMNPSHILTMITRQLRLILMAKELSPASRQEAMSRLGISRDFQFDRLLKQAKLYTIDTIKRAYHKILEADMAIKTGKYDDDLSVELLVMDLCEPRS